MAKGPLEKEHPTRLTVQRGTRSVNAAAPKLPHERDESPEGAAKPKPTMVQGYADVTGGLVDTDGREQAGRAFDNAPAKRKRK